jgi:hypothetical protein
MYLSSRIYSLLQGDDERWWGVAPDLDQFVEGRLLMVRKPQHRTGPTFIAELYGRGADPRDIWELRLTKIRPAIRLFGAFVQKDYFVALTSRYRPDLKFREAMRECGDAWAKLFGSLPRWKGRYPDAYLSNTKFVP